MHIQPKIQKEAARRPVRQQDGPLAARRRRQASGSRAASAASSGPGTGAAASRLALAREIAASTGYAQQACLNAATRPGLRSVCGGRAAQALRVVPGYQVDQARIADVPAGLGDLPATPMCCSPAGCWRAAWVAKPAHR